MTKRIIEMVREKKARIQVDLGEAETNAQLATEALMKGRLSLAWRKYMLQFIEKDPKDPNEPLVAEQLARLLASDNTLGDPVLDRKRAYMLSNGICGGGSPGQAVAGAAPFEFFDFNVNSIDDGLGVACLPELGETAKPVADAGFNPAANGAASESPAAGGASK